MYKFSTDKINIVFDPARWDFTLTIKNENWHISKKPYLLIEGDRKLSFEEAKCEHHEYKTGVVNGVYAEYTFDKEVTDLKVVTHMSVETTDGRLHFDARVENDKLMEVKQFNFPGAFSLNAEKGKGYTVFPVGMGALIPAKDETAIYGIGGGDSVYSRSMYMPFYGQMRNGSGYMAVYETPYDAKHYLEHIPDGDTTVEPIFIESLGKISYKREMIYDFYEECTYVSIAKSYRNYIGAKGLFVTLNEKAEKNPAIKRMYGMARIDEMVKINVKKGTKHYNTEDESQNQKLRTFDDIYENMKLLQGNGMKEAYVDIRGWCCDGYDHKHPDPFPIAPDAGGEEGFVRLQKKCTEMGYIFGVHDQYRDYYYDGDSFGFGSATLQPDGSYPYCNIWHGGEHTMLCAKLAPAYIKRNFDTFERMGAKIEGAYLDVFSIAELDECMDPDHAMTREQCAQYRREGLHLLNARGIITSSEEVIDCILPSIPMTDHALYLVLPTKDGKGRFEKAKGIPIPLFSLVYHECVIIPFMSRSTPNETAYGIPAGEAPIVHGALNGGTMFIQEYDDIYNLMKAKEVLELHKRVATLEMVNHEFIDGNIRCQRSEFSDGTKVEIDLDDSTFNIIYPDKQ
jgi:hypothetical protein